MFEFIFACAVCSEHNSHGNHDLEVAASVGASYILEENEVALATHFHGLFLDEPWGIGVGYGRLFGHHIHNAVSLAVQYNITHAWAVVMSPGISFEDNFVEVGPAFHLETTYAFFIGPLHLGPVVEGAVDGHCSHFTLGLHTGFGF